MKRIAAVIVAVALLTGCGAKASKKEAPAPVTPAPVQEPAPVKDPAPQVPVVSEDIYYPRTLKLADLRPMLEAYLNAAPAVGARERLTDLLARWDLPERQVEGVATIPMAEADLDGDGTLELVTALQTWGDWKSVPLGAAFVISRSDGQYKVDMSEPAPSPSVDGVALVTANADLTGDGKPEILWVAMDHGAHTTFLRVLVSRWQPGRVENLPGDLYTSTARLELDGRDLLLTGGEITSAGAGMSQRAATWRYRWVNGAFTMVDRRFAPSEYGYHRLLDGINAEVFGRDSEARSFFRSVLEPGREVLPDEALRPEWSGRFGPAVVELARFRLGLSLLRAGEQAAAQAVLDGATGPYASLSSILKSTADLDQACQAAISWATEHPDFIDEMNALHGYNAVKWSQFDVCAKVVPGTR